MRNSVGPILEGLNQNRINEGTSVFSSKLDAFIKNEEKGVQDFVKKALNAIFLGFKKKYGGYQEGKRPVQRDMGSYRIFTMKLQTNESTNYNFYDDVKEFFKPFKLLHARVKIDGEEYEAVFKDVDEAVGREETFAYRRADLTSPAKNILVGVATQYGANKQIDKTSKGDTFKVIVSIPVKDAKAFPENRFASKRGTTYSLSHDPVDGDSFGVEFDEGNNEFSMWSRDIDADGISSMDTFHILYKPSRKAREAFFEVMNTFNAKTTKGQVEQILSKYGVKLKHSWWFNPYID